MTRACSESPSRLTDDSAMHMPTTADRVPRRLVAVWGVLMLSMLGSWFSLGSTAVTLVTSVVIALALLKAVLVVGCYMEVVGAPSWLKAMCGIWITFVFVMIAALHLAPERILSLAGG